MSTTQQIFLPYPDPRKCPLVPKKVKNNPKIMLDSKVRIEWNRENKRSSTIWEEPKTFFLNSNQPQK